MTKSARCLPISLGAMMTIKLFNNNDTDPFIVFVKVGVIPDVGDEFQLNNDDIYRVTRRRWIRSLKDDAVVYLYVTLVN